MTDLILLEDGDQLLLEDGGGINQEAAVANTIGQSTSFESNNGTFVSAILTPTYTGNTPTLRMRADKNEAFEDVTSGVKHFFSNTGSEVQWQAEGSGTTISNIKIEAFR